MDVIDFHTHVFPDDLAEKAVAKLRGSTPGMINRTDGTRSGLKASMLRNGIGRSVTLPVATKPAQVEIINSEAGPEEDGIVSFGTMHPELRSVRDQVAGLRDRGVRGVKMHPEYQYFYADDPRMNPIYEELSTFGLVLVLHAGKDPGPFTSDHALPRALKTVIRNFPSLKLVAAHMGGWKVWDEVSGLLAGENLWFDTAAVPGFMDMREFVGLVRKHGAHRILFGSDSPWFDQGEVFRWIDRTSLDSREKEAIFSVNARRLLGQA